MHYIEEIREGARVNEIYLCKQKQTLKTKAGKPYDSVILQDKTGTLDAKIWEPGSAGIEDFDAMDYVCVMGDVTNFQGTLQLSIKRLRKAGEGEYEPKDYIPMTDQDVDVMYGELQNYVRALTNPYLKQLAAGCFLEDAEFEKRFKFHSAAKSVHHGFAGGLLEHTLGVAKLCDFYAGTYPLLNRDLLMVAALFHDVGKLDELSQFPANDYTDEGQLLGHIAMGMEFIGEKCRQINGFPKKLENELKHCILAHHGELEYGSPKKPALPEAVALNFADNLDAKMETMKEIFAKVPKGNTDWLGFNRLFESNLRRSSVDE